MNLLRYGEVRTSSKLSITSNNDKNPYISKDLSLLRYSVPDFLNRNENLLKIIKNITKADIKDGGEGAFYIFLKKFKE